ncbi:MAG: GGDEF domain-containing protein [Bacilli bacterium]
MAKVSDGFLFEQIARMLFEAETVQDAAAATAATLRETLRLHRVIFISTFTGFPRVIAYAGGSDFTAAAIERYFVSKLEQLRPLLQLTKPLFFHDYPAYPGALKAFVDTGSVSVALIPFEVRSKREAGLITLHRNATTEPWDATTERILVAVAQLIFMGLQRLYYFEENQRLLYTDELTGVGNRRVFLLDMDAHLRARDAFCLAIFDFDDFKRINDSYGHLTGDGVLQQVASCLQRLLPPPHRIYRLGGDEFAIYYAAGDQIVTENAIKEAMQRMTLDCAETLTRAIRFSVGCATAAEASWNLDQLIAKADSRMYEMKRRDKGRRTDPWNSSI